MLDHTISELANGLIDAKFDQRRDEFRRCSQELLNKMNARGILDSSIHWDELVKLCTDEIKIRVETVWEELKRTISKVGVSYSETLASDLRGRVEYYAPVGLWELGEQFRIFDDRTRVEKVIVLRSVRDREIQHIGAEINLYVAALKNASDGIQPGRPVPNKELEQKFKILSSVGQAVLDFDEWMSKANGGGQIALLFIDIDHFTKLNSDYSHARIDQTVLPDVMHLFARLVQSRGEAYRYGGEEFVIVLPNHDPKEAEAFAQKVRSKIDQHPFVIGVNMVKVTVSIGVAVWPECGATYQEVLQAANDAELIAKKTRNTVELADVLLPVEKE
jgi:diguanylate cyclase (GGDEF)-like protein